MTTIPVPVHKMELVCGLVTGEVVVGVRPALPVEGFDMVLGIELAGKKVWPDVAPPYVVTQCPELLPLKTEVEKSEVEPEVELFPVYAITRTMGCTKDKAVSQEKVKIKNVLPLISVPLESISHGQLVQEQRSVPL